MSFNKSGVKWEEASCNGMNRDLFFQSVDKSGRLSNAERQHSALNITLRPICMACPIWEGCLKWAFKNEDWGVWGGLNELERQSFKSKVRLQATKQMALKELAKYGISEGKIRSLM